MTDNFYAEQSLIGSMLIEPGCVPDVLQTVRAEDFGSDANRILFETIRDLFGSGEQVDPVVVAQEAQRRGVTNADQYVVDILTVTPTAANVGRYAAIVHENGQRQTILGIADDLSAAARFGDLAETVAGALSELQTITSNGSVVPVDGAESIANFREWVRAAKQDPGHAVVPTNYSALDDMLGGGLVKTGLYVIGARPGMGKTTVALNLATYIAAVGRKVLFVSLEMDAIQIVTKRISIGTGLPFSALYNGRISDEDEELINRAADRISQMQLDVVDSGIGSVADLASFLQLHQYDAVFVDYLGILAPAADDLQKPRYEQITNISMNLKKLAKQLHVPIVTLSQLNRESTSKSNKRPTLTDLRDSGAIEQDADGVILLYRAGYFETEKPDVEPIEFIVAKNRHGETGTVQLTWHASSGRVYEQSNREEP